MASIGRLNWCVSRREASVACAGWRHNVPLKVLEVERSGFDGRAIRSLRRQVVEEFQK